MIEITAIAMKNGNGGNERTAKLFGNRIRASRGRNDVLMTVRRDVLSIRESLLDKRLTESLEKTDWLVDQLDNMLAEG